MHIWKKYVSAALVALTLGAGAVGTSTPAAAWGYRGGGHAWGGPHFGGGWGYRRGWGGPVAAGVFGGLALGALAASTYHPYYEPCHLARSPVVDNFGYVVGYRNVRVCN